MEVAREPAEAAPVVREGKWALIGGAAVIAAIIFLRAPLVWLEPRRRGLVCS